MAGTARKSTGSKRKSTKVVRQSLKRKIVKVDPQVRVEKIWNFVFHQSLDLTKIYLIILERVWSFKIRTDLALMGKEEGQE